MNDGVKSLEVLNADVTNVFVSRGYRSRLSAKKAGVKVSCVQTGDKISVLDKVRHQDGPDVTVMPCDENLHRHRISNFRSKYVLMRFAQ
jgi:hypothetical protein